MQIYPINQMIVLLFFSIGGIKYLFFGSTDQWLFSDQEILPQQTHHSQYLKLLPSLHTE